MRGVIYVDMLVAVNFILDYFLLAGAGLLSGSRTGGLRGLLGAAAASLFSLALLLPPLPAAAQLALKAAGSVLPVLIAFRFTGVRQALRTAGWFLLLNVLLAGAVLFAVWQWSATGILHNNLAVYFNISPVILVLCVLAVYCALQLLSLLFGRPQRQWRAELELTLGGRRLCAQALVDTGFSLCDLPSGQPCVLLCYPAVRARLAPAAAAALASYYAGGTPAGGQGPPLRLTPCRTVAGESLLPTFFCERCQIRCRGRQLELGRVPVAFAAHPLAGQGCEGLIGTALLEPIL